MGSLRWIAVHRLAVPPGTVAQHVGHQFRQFRIVLLELGPGVDVIVQRVVLAIVVEPVLYGFRPVFTGIGAGIGSLEQAARGGILVGGPEPPFKIRPQRLPGGAVDGVGELVNENVLGRIRVVRVT